MLLRDTERRPGSFPTSNAHLSPSLQAALFRFLSPSLSFGFMNRSPFLLLPLLVALALVLVAVPADAHDCIDDEPLVAAETMAKPPPGPDGELSEPPPLQPVGTKRRIYTNPQAVHR